MMNLISVTELAGFFFGLALGSFLNVVAYRLPRGRSVVFPPSACPACGTRIRWHDNIPVAGWLMLRGRCRACRAGISPAYPLMELAAGLVTLGLIRFLGVTPALAACLPLAYAGLVLGGVAAGKNRP